MAGSRTEKIGTIFTRVTGLLRSGAMKDVDKPIWYDVYEAFPPITEPRYDRFQEEHEPRNLLYKEDLIRAKFYKTFGSPDVIDMKNFTSVPLSERFISLYTDMEKAGVETSSIFDKVTDLLKAEGIHMKTVEEIHREKKLAALKARLDNQSKQKSGPKVQDMFGSAGATSEVPDSVTDEQFTPVR